jgi:UDPglucose 6-dehydrogenase
VRALVHSANTHGVTLGVLSAVESANDRQKRVLVDKVTARFGTDLHGRTFAVWGLAFKPNTDDMREAPSRVIIDALIAQGARVRAYDPVANAEAKRLYREQPALTLVDSRDEALDGADALLVVTEWREFKSPDFDAIRASLKQPIVFDGRNLFEPALLRSLGIEYHGIGRA